MSESFLCTEDTQRQVEEYARQLCVLLRQYKWIAESYVVEFYAKDHWSRLPSSWQLALSSLTPPDVAEVLLTNPHLGTSKNYPGVMPLSLLAFLAGTHALALCRTVAHPAGQHPQSGRNPDLSHCYRTHVKPKKQHEIERLAKVIHSTCDQAGCNRVVDVGSGQGHLSRLLSFGYGHSVTSIEAVDCHVSGAAKFDREVKMLVERKARADEEKEPTGISSPHHVVSTVHPHITVEEFLSVINAQTQSNQGDGTYHSTAGSDLLERQEPGSKRVKMESGVAAGNSSGCSHEEQQLGDANPNQLKTHSTESPSPTSTLFDQRVSPDDSCNPDCQASQVRRHSKEDRFLVTGLHTCGDLGPTMLRTFAECPQAVALASVACCYMRMSFCDKSGKSNHNSDEAPSSQSESTAENCTLENMSNSETDRSISRDLGMKDTPENPRQRLQNTQELEVGFPMSKSVRSLFNRNNFGLTFEPLELACHFLEGYRERLQGNGPSLLTQGYRAVLEVLIQEQGLGLIQSPEGARKIRKAVSSVKRPHLKSFEDYASTILSKLGLQSDPDRIKSVRDSLLPRWHRLVTFHSIRQLLAPIIESLVLVDRCLFLLQKGIESRLVPIFDPHLSPRNLVLLAVKQQHQQQQQQQQGEEEPFSGKTTTTS